MLCSWHNRVKRLGLDRYWANQFVKWGVWSWYYLWEYLIYIDSYLSRDTFNPEDGIRFSFFSLILKSLSADLLGYHFWVQVYWARFFLFYWVLMIINWQCHWLGEDRCMIMINIGDHFSWKMCEKSLGLVALENGIEIIREKACKML